MGDIVDYVAKNSSGEARSFTFHYDKKCRIVAGIPRSGIRGTTEYFSLPALPDGPLPDHASKEEYDEAKAEIAILMLRCVDVAYQWLASSDSDSNLRSFFKKFLTDRFKKFKWPAGVPKDDVEYLDARRAFLTVQKEVLKAHFSYTGRRRLMQRLAAA